MTPKYEVAFNDREGRVVYQGPMNQGPMSYAQARKCSKWRIKDGFTHVEIRLTSMSAHPWFRCAQCEQIRDAAKGVSSRVPGYGNSHMVICAGCARARKKKRGGA